MTEIHIFHSGPPTDNPGYYCCCPGRYCRMTKAETLNMEKSHLHIGRLCQNAIIYGPNWSSKCAKLDCVQWWFYVYEQRRADPVNMQSGGGEVVGGGRKISQHAEIQHIFVFILQAIIYGHLHLLSVKEEWMGGWYLNQCCPQLIIMVHNLWTRRMRNIHNCDWMAENIKIIGNQAHPQYQVSTYRTYFSQFPPLFR